MCIVIRALHRAAFEGRIAEMQQIINLWNEQQRMQFDPQGNTVGYIFMSTP